MKITHVHPASSTHSVATAHDHCGHAHPTVNEDQKWIDPVCGMTVDKDVPLQYQHEGQIYRFCSEHCLHKFKADPTAYLHKEETTTPDKEIQTETGVMYTCPMHPDIRQDHPGNCPKCGMALEREQPILEEEENPELRDFQHRFWFTLPLTVVVTLLAMFGHRAGLFSMNLQSWVELGLSLPVVLWAGWPFFTRWAQSLIHRSPNMWTLIGTGTGAAFLYSVVATIVPDIFPLSFQSMGRVAVYFEAADVIISLTLLG